MQGGDLATHYKEVPSLRYVRCHPGDIKTMEGSFDNQYFIDGYKNKKAHWRGLGKSHIYYLPLTKTWRLESLYETDQFALLAADDSVPRAFYPLGRSVEEF